MALEEIKLVPETSNSDQRFGASVAMRGNFAAIGARGDNGAGPGQAFIYDVTNGGWDDPDVYELVQTPQTVQRFGNQVALGDHCAVVAGTPDAKTPNDHGAVYVYTPELGVWDLPHHSFSSETLADAWGDSLSVSEDCRTIVVGAPERTVNGFIHAGAADILEFNDDLDEYVLTKELTEPSPNAEHRFGDGVAISPMTRVVAVGARYLYPSDGPVFVRVWQFNPNVPEWQHVADHKGDASSPDAFGVGLQLTDDNTMVVGASEDSDGTGAVYVCPNALDMTPCDKLPVPSAPMLNVQENLGVTVRLDGDHILAGAPIADGLRGNTGLVFRWRRQGDAWVLSDTPPLAASDGKYGDGFGAALAADNGVVLVGAEGHLIGLKDQAGAAYVYRPDQTGAPCDVNEPDDCETGFCVDDVCCADACGGGDPNDALVCSIAAGSSMNGSCESLPDETTGDETGSSSGVTSAPDTSGDGTTADTTGDEPTTTAEPPTTTNSSETSATSDGPQACVDPDACAPGSSSGCTCDLRDSGFGWSVLAPLLLLLRRPRSTRRRSARDRVVLAV